MAGDLQVGRRQGGSSALQRRRLGQALRRLRDQAKLTGDEAGQAVERSGSWISRVEAGRVGVRLRELRDLFELYGLTNAREREDLEALAQSGKRRGWWSSYGLPESYAVYVGLEDEAESLRMYHNLVVPGLFQTERYMRAVFQRGIPKISPET